MKPVFSVSEVTQIIKNLLEGSAFLQQVYIKGEISNFKHHISGHMYFTLKDEKSQIRCIMFRSSNILLNFNPENGMKVTAFGHISVFEKTGEYQLYVEDLEPEGVGDLHIAFERLKAKLEKEGLFNPARKRPIPFLPRRIGLVTSITGAAVRDLLTVIKRRYPNANIVIAPVLVQGKEAASQICSAIGDLNNLGEVEVIIVGRGGGSIEELWAFNEETVARAIYSSKVPVISAVGHETDITIADLVADKRAPTPSAAGEMVVPEKNVLKNEIRQLKNRLITAAMSNINLKRQRLEYIRKSATFIKARNMVLNYRYELDRHVHNLFKNMKIQIDGKKLIFKSQVSKLQALSPLAVLQRGYSICQSFQSQKIIRKVEDVCIGEMVFVVLSDGKLLCRVKDRGKR
ncbi:MAG TPA: exodeoxyribonuclease VII large subunit [Thermoanaerobacterales bacterium]|nr:exodeoxyribonuclease VII large subunit [Thermoanaerobacterales bacterium]